MDQVIERLRSVVADRLDVDAQGLSYDANFADDMKADSLALVDLIMAIEDEFAIRIPEEDYKRLTSVRAMRDYIQSRLA